MRDESGAMTTRDEHAASDPAEDAAAAPPPNFIRQIVDEDNPSGKPGRPVPDRDRPIDENLDLFGRMRAGEFPDGKYTLRAQIDMASPNFKMRDPPMYRIRHAPHHRTGDKWCIYPLYDFTHCLSDSI